MLFCCGFKVALGVIFEVFLYLRFYLRYCHEILHTYRCLPLQLLKYQSSVGKILFKYFLRINNKNGYTFAPFKNL